MPKLNSTVKAVRIDNDKLESLERMLNGRSINSWMNEKIAEAVEGKPIGSASNDLSEIESMANFFRMGLDEFLKGVCDGLMDGSLTVEGGKVVGVPLVNLEGLEEACHERGISMQDAIDKTVKTLRGNR